jgi:D-arginine dehydrogenase
MVLSMSDSWDVVVIGAGMAGASAGAELAARRRVLVLEREDQPGRHSTGRSAALFDPGYGNAAVRALTRASRSFLEAPPAGFAQEPLLSPRGVLTVAPAQHLAQLAAREVELRPTMPALVRLSAEEARARVPVLRPDWIAGALLDPTGMDLDVNAQHQGYLRMLRARGGRVVTSAEVTRLERSADLWRVTTSQGVFSAPVVVNAAGAWADEVAALAGLRRIGLQPLRRTALIIDAPVGVSVRSWPLVIAAAETFYFKPDAGRLLVSPADQTPSPPCDARPEAEDLALAVARLQEACDLEVTHLIAKWAGLRTFAPDRTPVAGFDHRARGFFWLAGQGGYGIQTAPALSQLTAALVAGESVPPELTAAGVRADDLAPARFRRF